MMRAIERTPSLALAIWGILFALTIVMSLYLCGGHLVYSVDDSYIHLSLAHNILRGTYGTSLGEPSSPSSSILWPWLLTAPEFIGLGWISPLLLDAVAALATVYVSARFLHRLGWVSADSSLPLRVGISLVVIFATNSIALPITGLEHMWHVLTVVIALDGLVATAEGGRPGGIFLASLVAMPLFRFEGAAFAGAAIIAVFCLGHRKAAIGTAAVLTLALAAYAAFMSHLNLPLLPGSVLLKSDVMATAMTGQAGGFARAELRNAFHNLLNPRGLLVAAALLVLMLVSYLQRKDKRPLAVYLPVMAAIFAHLLGGQFGGLNRYVRYEVYIMALALFALFYAASAVPRVGLWSAAWVRYAAFFIVGAAFAATYVIAAVETPATALITYEQQYQIRRFALEDYKAPIGVNDLGLISYGNPNFILDLFGLGSETVRRLRLEGKYGPTQMAKLADDHDVALVIIYKDWATTGLPPGWREVATLRILDKQAAGIDEPDVNFFVTPRANLGAVESALLKFKANLPPRDDLRLAVE